ncbi:MAG TPA: DUF4912 domain-containing protein [Chthoniobacterales bacterium]|nr:DUF4912 domain-containing protein [Chthoniobacterales bacterium]
MPPPNSKSPAEPDRRDFRVSRGSLVTLAETERVDFIPNAVELPRFYGEPLLFAIGRDPRTIFAYWSIDWASIFDTTAPVDRQVHLRVYRDDGAEETAAAAEPMAGNCYITVSQPRARYRVELGYYQPKNSWHGIATSEEVTMPPDSVSEATDVDLATIPLHLSFQRLIDLFRANNSDALTEIISRLQRRAVTAAERDLLTPEELEILRAMNVSLEEMESGRALFHDRQMSEAALRRRAETLLGFGASSRGHAFSASSWG